MKKQGGIQKITVDQTPERLEEKERIQNNGGMVNCLNGVYRVDGSLAVSRAIGNSDIKSYIIAEPEVSHHDLQDDDDLLILTSDGLMRVYDEKSLANDIRTLRSQGASLEMITKAIFEQACQDYNCRDNLSLVIVDLSKHLIKVR